MGTAQQNKQFIQTLRTIPGIIITSESRPYANRGTTTLERVYLELEQNTVYETAEVVQELLNYPGIFNY